METTHVSIHHPDNIKNTQYNVSQPCYFIRVVPIYKEMDQINFAWQLNSIVVIFEKTI